MKTVKINLYEFNELTEQAKEKAINEAIIYLDSEPIEHEDEKGKMISEYIDHTEEDAEEFINANEYLFFSNGYLANTVEYCGKHPRAGESELILNGETYKF